MTNAQRDTINWRGAIEKNRTALLRIVEMLFALIGRDGNAAIATLPRCTRNYVLRILRPAEAAARRLIAIAARGMEVVMSPSGERKGPPSTSVILGLDPRTHSGDSAKSSKTRNNARLLIAGGGRRLHGLRPRVVLGLNPRTTDDARCSTSWPISQVAPSLALLDPLKRFDLAPRRYATTAPRVLSLGGPALPVYMRVPEPPAKPLPTPDDPQDARRLCIRLQALKRALDDLPGQARRLARWKARRDLGVLRARRLSPMRPGWPPGHRKRPAHEIDDILRECHALARSAWEDSS